MIELSKLPSPGKAAVIGDCEVLVGPLSSYARERPNSPTRTGVDFSSSSSLSHEEEEECEVEDDAIRGIANGDKSNSL